MHELLTASGRELARRIRSGQNTSEQVVTAHIERIRAVNGRINAMVAERFAAALAEARAADVRIADGDTDRLPAYFGVPCSVKESIQVTGMPNTAGLVARLGLRITEDATAVRRLRTAGAIPLGVTNTPELCMWVETNNRIYGRSRNIYDPARTVGGSSGGEGALIAAGGVPFGIGSDIGGSIRLPAFFNGVFGHKATGALVPTSGQFPVTYGLARRYKTTGPICRQAEDLWPLLTLLAGPDGEDPACEEMTLGDPENVKIQELTVWNVAEHPRYGLRADLKAAQQKCAEHLRRKGARVIDTVIPEFEQSRQIWSAMLADTEGPRFAERLGNGSPINIWSHLLRWPFRATPHTFPALVLALIENQLGGPPEERKRLVKLGQDLRHRLTEQLGANSVMLYPSFSRPAPRHNLPILLTFHFAYTGIFNMLEFPVTQVPLGLNRKGLPLGIQVAAAPANDHLTIALACELEKAFGGWVFPGRR